MESVKEGLINPPLEGDDYGYNATEVSDGVQVKAVQGQGWEERSKRYMEEVNENG